MAKKKTEPIMPKKETQEYTVLQHIRKNFLSQYEAVMRYDITDLAGRIKRLKEKGWKIVTIRRARTDSEGREVKHWNEYRLEK